MEFRRQFLGRCVEQLTHFDTNVALVIRQVDIVQMVRGDRQQGVFRPRLKGRRKRFSRAVGRLVTSRRSADVHLEPVDSAALYQRRELPNSRSKAVADWTKRQRDVQLVSDDLNEEIE